jgi:hypothetical protein
MASAEIAESVTHAITPAVCMDDYYSGEGNTELQCFPTLQDNRYYFSLPSINQGATNTIIFNPDQGLSDIVLTATLPISTGVSGAGSYAGYAMPRGWLQAMISQVALRVGGSALYYFTGDQIFVDTLTDCEDSGKKQAVMNFAGGELLQQSDFSLASQTAGAMSASVYLKMPFNSISALQKSLPLPTDLLTQPIQILVSFKNFADVAFWYGAGAPVPSNLPSQFASAQVNFRKTTLQSSEHLLARREDMMTRALTYPLRYFSQTTFRTNVNFTAGVSQTINLTGFRSGSVKYIDVWATPVVSPSNSSIVPGSNWNWVQPSNVRLLINGLVMYDARDTNASFWSLCERKTPAQVDTTTLTATAGNASATAVPSVMPWTPIPFAQLCEPHCYGSDVVLGFPIQNSVVNLELTMPVTGSYTISASYHYVSSLMFSKNTAEYVF